MLQMCIEIWVPIKQCGVVIDYLALFDELNSLQVDFFFIEINICSSIENNMLYNLLYCVMIPNVNPVSSNSRK